MPSMVYSFQFVAIWFLSLLSSCRAFAPSASSFITTGTRSLLVAKEATHGTDRTMTKTRLITNKMCPFAQKAWIALETSKTPFEMQEISLYGANGKPDWFWELNPQGTVPVVVYGNGETVLPDSDLILDQIDQISAAAVETTAPLCPSNLKSDISDWRQRINDMLPVGKQSVFANKPSSKLKQQLKAMNDAVKGSYLTGQTVTVADCHAFPFLWRLNTEFPLEKEYPQLAEWIQTCSNLPSFRKTIQSSWWWWW